MTNTEGYDPDERVSLFPLEAEDVLKRLLGGEGADEVAEGPEDEEEPEI
ncbi:MAG: hypothetical protein ACLQK4_15815 [Acidimicrobiales bacterium]